jgi:hypothetical protein
MSPSAAFMGHMPSPLRYLAALNTARIVLWCYAIWYGINVYNHFDARPRLWITSVGLSVIIGCALYLSTRNSSSGTTHLEGWQIFRLFLMPFCVSSFSALVKDAGYVLIFPPTIRENLAGALAIGCFLFLVFILKQNARRRFVSVQ